MINYIEENELLSTFQSGYRTRHSCETALNFVLAQWREMRENGDDILAVFLDLKRAFETIDRNRLLTKLSAFGFSTRVINWFEGYLKERSQLTKVNGCSSRKIQNDLGVPQDLYWEPFCLYFTLTTCRLSYKTPSLTCSRTTL